MHLSNVCSNRLNDFTITVYAVADCVCRRTRLPGQQNIVAIDDVARQPDWLGRCNITYRYCFWLSRLTFKAKIIDCGYCVLLLAVSLIYCLKTGRRNQWRVKYSYL